MSDDDILTKSDGVIELRTTQCAEVARFMYEKWQEAMKPPLLAYYDFPTWLDKIIKEGGVCVN